MNIEAMNIAEENITAHGFFEYAYAFASSASALRKVGFDKIDRKNPITHREAPIRYGYRHAIELYLKAFLKMHDYKAKDLSNRPLGHDIGNLLKDCEENGLNVSDMQRVQLGLLGDSTADRYIGHRGDHRQPIDALHDICIHLNDQMGDAVYRSANLLKRRYPKLL